jgi:Zn-dependent M28 family amino/carboxypeptidase
VVIFCTNAFAQEPGRLEEQMHFLTDSLCEGRSTGSRGGALAAMWIAKEFSRLGLSETDSTWFRGFIAASGEKGRNVIGLLPGSVQGSRRRYILVGAHYDHIGTLGHTLYPGADSNASGVVSMLTLADLFSGDGKQYAHSILFVAFDAKVHGMGGSKELVRLLQSGAITDPETGLPISLRSIDLMVNIDQVGGTSQPLSSGRKDYLMMLSDERSGRRQNLIEANRGGPQLDISFSYYGSKDFTNLFYRKAADQKAFLDAGVPSVMFTSGITMYNNKPLDRPDVIDFEVLSRRIRLMYLYLVSIL